MIDDLLKKFSKQHKFISQEMLYEMYAVVSLDIENQTVDRGVWAKAFADAKGDEQVAKAAYIELMVERLILAKEAEQEVSHQSRRELSKSETKKKPQKVENNSSSVKDFITNDSVGLENTTGGQVFSVILLSVMVASLFGLYLTVGATDVFIVGAFVCFLLVAAAWFIAEQIYKVFTKK